MSRRVEARGLSKSFRRGQAPAVKAASFAVEEGSLLALVGESGSGKTTLLRLLAGLEGPDEGEILLDGEIISSKRGVVPPERRGIGLVFQQHALFPHLSVERNVGFGLRHLAARERALAIGGALELVGMGPLAQRFPHELSGGERQRVALARALAPNPRLILLDEPFSSLDARLRQSVRDETRAILAERGATAVFVTHDTCDALSVGDRVVVLRQGEVQQVGTPEEVYHTPSNAYVASFMGACNFIPEHATLRGCQACARCHVGPRAEGGGVGAAAGFDRSLWIRPENLVLADPATPAPNALVGVVSKVSFQGASVEVALRCEAPGVREFEVLVRHHGGFAVRAGERWAVVPRAG